MNGGPVSLEARFTITSEALDIDYSVKNTGTAPVYLLDRTVQVESGGGISVGQAEPRVEFVPPGTARICLKLFPIPKGTQMTVPPMAYARKLQAGEQVRDRLTLPLPLYEWKTFAGENGSAVNCPRVCLSLGIVPERPDLQARSHDFAGEPIWRLGPAAWQHQQVLTAERSLSTDLLLKSGR